MPVYDADGLAGRVDCLTPGRAWEIEHAPRWRESIGQALLYASHTGTLPGVVLIIEGPAQCLHLRRMWTALAALPEPRTKTPLSAGFAVVTIGHKC